MGTSNNNDRYQDGEISFREIILKIKGWYRYLLGKWKIILLFAIIGAGLGIFYSLTSKIKYTAKLSFVVEESKPNALGAYAGLASQFGIDVGSSMGSGVFSGDNIVEFLQSRLMMEKALLTPVLLGEKPRSLADYYLDVSGQREQWVKNPALQQLRFPVTSSRQGFSLQQDSILYVIYKHIKDNQLTVSKPDKKLSFIWVECKSTDEQFAKLFTERLVKEATDFYIQTKLQRSKTTVDKLQFKADSLESMLNRKTYSVAESQDLNLNPARNIAGVRTELMARDKIVLQTMYGEVIKNLELSRMAMEQETPIIQIVDSPILPLIKEKTGIVKGAVLGGVLFAFLTVLALLFRRIYQVIMNN